MHKDELFEYLEEQHKNTMLTVGKETPPVNIKTILIRKDEHRGKFRLEFNIINSSAKIKIVKMIEEKVFIQGKHKDIQGTVIDTGQNSLIIIAKGTFDINNEYIIKRHSNYNNEILLEEFSKFKHRDKFLTEEMYSLFTKKHINLFDQENCNVDVDNSIPLFNKNLNESQKMAVYKTMNNDTPFKILGPPGTGKTETIVEIILQSIQKNKKLIVCGPSNTSIDNIILRFLHTEYYSTHQPKFYRLGSSHKGLSHFNLEHMANESVGFMERGAKGSKNSKAKKSANLESKGEFNKDRSNRIKKFILELRNESNVVFSTLFSSLKENFFYDICIIDEACQATLIESFMGIVKAKTFILVGDPNQLSPMYSNSMYEHLNLETILLNEQYRMHEDLLRFSNSTFYQNLIVSKNNDDFTFLEQSKILFIDTSYFNYEESTMGESKVNIQEAQIVKTVVEYLTSFADPKEIGVIVPYSAQAFLLQNLVDCKVETVDGFQGQEKDFIILGLVRSNSFMEIGFLSDKRRLNVALTRCKKGLIIVGDSSNFVKDKLFNSLFRYLENHACVLDPEMFSSICENK